MDAARRVFVGHTTGRANGPWELNSLGDSSGGKYATRSARRQERTVLGRVRRGPALQSWIETPRSCRCWWWLAEIAFSIDEFSRAPVRCLMRK